MPKHAIIDNAQTRYRKKLVNLSCNIRKEYHAELEEFMAQNRMYDENRQRVNNNSKVVKFAIKYLMENWEG